MLLRPGFLEDNGLVKVTAMLKEDTWNHAIVAREQGSNLRAHLEERAGYREDSWYAVSFLSSACVLPCQEQLQEPLQVPAPRHTTLLSGLAHSAVDGNVLLTPTGDPASYQRSRKSMRVCRLARGGADQRVWAFLFKWYNRTWHRVLGPQCSD